MAGKSKSKLDWWHSINQVMVMFGVGLGFGIYGPSLMDLAEIYSSPPRDIALMNSARAIGMFLGSCTGGFFYNFMNDQILTLIFLIIYGAGTVVTPLLPSIWYLHVCGFVAGTSFGIAHIGAQVRLVKVWSDKSASAIQAFHSAYGVGSMIGPFFVAPFLSLKDDEDIMRETQLHIPYAAFGLLYAMVAGSMIAAYLYDPATIKKTKVEDEHKDDPAGKRSETFLMVLLFIYLCMCVNSEHTFGTFISVYAINSPDLEFSRSEAAYIAGIYWSTFTCGRLISIFLAALFDLQQLLVLSHSLVIGGSAMLIVWRSSEVCAWIGSGIMGLGLSSMYGAASGLVFEYVRIRHSYVGAILAAACLGLAISAHAVPPFIGTWPMFLQYYMGVGNVLNTLVLVVMFLALRGRSKLTAKKEEAQEMSRESVVA
ncbi:sodium-dependent glucose transporter 1 [Galendromus occidentalis]|uniref:Sodium-dependent glucose transporter 1 n=1 Tax=Galendromus occidentalis TaxID=34638 RepID=A0AAJ6VZD1_9ACAR|nr:sodium-dependent glucose transporter 1 [Galendromus occidentalis]